MTIQRLKRLQALAKQIDALLTIQFTGRIVVAEITEDSAVDGTVSFWHQLRYTDDADDGSVGWEYYSEREGDAIARPLFLLEDGDTIGEKQALALAKAKLSESIATVQ